MIRKDLDWEPSINLKNGLQQWENYIGNPELYLESCYHSLCKLYTMISIPIINNYNIINHPEEITIDYNMLDKNDPTYHIHKTICRNSKLVEEFKIPSFVMSIDGAIVSGPIRSTKNIDISKI